MRGIVSFKQFYPEWKGHWNYLSKDNQETVNRSQTISYKRSPRIWPFIPEDEKQNYDTFTDSVRKGVKMAYPDYQEYLSDHLKKYACGRWVGSFYMDNSRVPILECFRLGIAYCGPVASFDPATLPKTTLSYAQYASHLLFSTPTTGLIVLSGVGENEFGLFKALVCINPDEAVMTTIKSYFHDQSSPAAGPSQPQAAGARQQGGRGGVRRVQQQHGQVAARERRQHADQPAGEVPLLRRDRAPGARWAAG